MPRDLRIVVPDRPGAGRELFEAIAAAGINIDGVASDIRPGERWVAVHILVDDGPRTRAAIEGAGFEISGDREVDVVQLEDRPGAVYEVLQAAAAEQKNIEVIYLATGTRLVIGTEDLHEPRHGVRMEDARWP